MPLSENEQRQLEAIERALLADDPKFAAAVRTSDLRSHARRRLVRGVAVAVLGFVLLVLTIVSTVLGVVGAALMVVGGAMAVSAWRRTRGGVDVGWSATGPRGTGPRGGRPARAPRKGLRERAEERFKKRFDDPGL